MSSSAATGCPSAHVSASAARSAIDGKALHWQGVELSCSVFPAQCSLKMPPRWLSLFGLTFVASDLSAPSDRLLVLKPLGMGG